MMGDFADYRDKLGVSVEALKGNGTIGQRPG
jgi:hypothetical protein